MSKRIKKRSSPKKIPAKFPGVVEALRYARDVIAGKTPACQHVVNACARHFNDLKKNVIHHLR